MQLVYFNDLHKNLGCNKGRTAKISIIPVTFTVSPVIFCALPFSSASFFSHALSPPASNCPVRTDISIAQKTCEFRPVDISVSLTKCNKLIYQSVCSLLETMVGIPLPSAHCVRSHLPQGDGFLAVAGKFLIAPKTLATGLTVCALSVKPYRACQLSQRESQEHCRKLPRYT